MIKKKLKATTRKTIAMLTMVAMLNGCGVMNKIGNIDLLSTKPPQSEEQATGFKKRQFLRWQCF
jgi:ABC-type uncharacterized transport system auxiliary subunit